MALWTFLLAWGALLGALLAVALRFSGKPGRRPPRQLSLLLLLFSVTLVEHFRIAVGHSVGDDHGFIVFLSTPLTVL
jgi:hypothetical protein